jgi:hypothetical protein
MSNYYIYADEAGCFTFNRNPNVSKYFIIATIITNDWKTPTLGLQELRHNLIAEGLRVDNYFHATTDCQAVRDRVYEEISKYNFSIQATICEKSKAQPQVTESKARFYKTPWFFHCKLGLATQMSSPSLVHMTAASIGTKKEKLTFTKALNDVQSQSFKTTPCNLDFRPCSSDPCLQIADYCAWAIQRKWEKGDTRSYNLIKTRITREYDLWSHGINHYY